MRIKKTAGRLLKKFNMTTEIEYYRLKRHRYVPIKSESVQPGDTHKIPEFGIIAICDSDNFMSTIAVGYGR